MIRSHLLNQNATSPPMKTNTTLDKAAAKLAAHPIRITPVNEARLAAAIKQAEGGATLWTITPYALTKLAEHGEAELDRLQIPRAFRVGAEVHSNPPARYWGQPCGGGTFCTIVRQSRHWALIWVAYGWQEVVPRGQSLKVTSTVALTLAQQRYILDSNPHMGELSGYLANLEKERDDYERENDLLGVCVSDLRNDLRRADLLNEALRSKLAKAEERFALPLNRGTEA